MSFILCDGFVSLCCSHQSTFIHPILSMACLFTTIHTKQYKELFSPTLSLPHPKIAHKHTDTTDPHSPDRCASHTTTPSPAATPSSPASPSAPRNAAAKTRSTARALERRTWARRWCCGAGGAGVWGSNGRACKKRGDGTGTHGMMVVELWGCAEMCTGLRTISV